MTTLVPCLWCDGNAEEIVDYYCRTLPETRLVHRWARPLPGGGEAPSLLEFEVCGHRIQALNAGPQFPFTPAISLALECESQELADQVFDALVADGAAMACGWVADRFGVAWQVVPPGMSDLLFDPDPARSAAAFTAMENQQKLNVAAIRAAVEAV